MEEIRGLGLDLNLPQNDERDFNLDVLGGWFEEPYTPKYQRVILPTLSTKNQKRQYTCVCESGALQKEVDEGVVLSPQGVVCSLVEQEKMTKDGTSLINYQNETKTFGIPEWGYMPNNYDASWEEFSNPKLLTPEARENAKKHIAGSFWRTNNIGTVLRQIDLAHESKLKNGIGQTGAPWYSGYNPSQVKAPYIFQPFDGVLISGHAFILVGYDLNYHGNKVVACKTSYGEGIYDNEIFYIKFEDFSKILTFGVYYTLDIPRDVAGFLAKNANKAIIENNGPKVYVIEDGKKRYVPDEALMWMLDITPGEIVKDSENYLKEVPVGEDMGIKDIPLERQESIKYFVQMSLTPGFMKDRFKKYFPDLIK